MRADLGKMTLFMAAFASGSCVRDFDQFVRGDASTSNDPHFEAPMTLCTEPALDGPARIRVVNITRYDDVVPCAQANGSTVALTGSSAASLLPASKSVGTPVALPSARGVRFWFGYGDGACSAGPPSYGFVLDPVNLTAGATYDLVLVDRSVETYQLVRESSCDTPSRGLVHLLNATTLTIDIDLTGRLGEQISMQSVSSFGGEASARPDRSYVSLAANIWTISMHASGETRPVYSTTVNVSPQKQLWTLTRTGEAQYGIVLCPEGWPDVVAPCTSAALGPSS